MIFQKKHVAVAAGGSVLNAATLAGLVGIRPRVPSKAQLSLSASGDLVQVRFIIGSEVLMNSAEVNASNRYPLYPDDIAVPWTGVYAGEDFSLEFLNASAAARDIYWKLELLPLSG
jgi:hypothetical protein